MTIHKKVLISMIKYILTSGILSFSGSVFDDVSEMVNDDSFGLGDLYMSFMLCLLKSGKLSLSARKNGAVGYCYDFDDSKINSLFEGDSLTQYALGKAPGNIKRESWIARDANKIISYAAILCLSLVSKSNRKEFSKKLTNIFSELIVEFKSIGKLKRSLESDLRISDDKTLKDLLDVRIDTDRSSETFGDLIDTSLLGYSDEDKDNYTIALRLSLDILDLYDLTVGGSSNVPKLENSDWYIVQRYGTVLFNRVLRKKLFGKVRLKQEFLLYSEDGFPSLYADAVYFPFRTTKVNPILVDFKFKTGDIFRVGGNYAYVDDINQINNYCFRLVELLNRSRSFLKDWKNVLQPKDVKYTVSDILSYIICFKVDCKSFEYNRYIESSKTENKVGIKVFNLDSSQSDLKYMEKEVEDFLCEYVLRWR